MRPPSHIRALLWSAGLAAGISLACAPRTARADDEVTVSDEARAHFRAGVNLLHDPEGERVEEAFLEFQGAYAASKSPKILGNIGYCALKLERDGEAIEAYTNYLRAVPDIAAVERAQIVRDLQTLTASASTVRVKLRPSEDILLVDTRIAVRGSSITNIYNLVGDKSLVLRPGHHNLRLRRRSGAEVGVWEFDAVAGASIEHVFELDRPPPPGTQQLSAPTAPPPNKAVPITLTIAGGALLGGAVITGLMAMKSVGNLENHCSLPNNGCPAADASNQNFDASAEKSRAKTFSSVTDVLLLAGGISAAVGVGWLLFGSKAPRASLAAACGPTGCSGNLRVPLSF